VVIKEKDFMPVIIGSDINSYSIARAFHEEYQIKSLVVSRYLWGPTANSKIIDNITYEDIEEPGVLVKKLIEIAKERKNKKLILLACGDWYVSKIIEAKDILDKYYIIPSIEEEKRNKLVKKDYFYQICKELNIDYPKTHVIDCSKKIDEMDLNFDFDYPIIAKPADSNIYHYVNFPGKKKGFKFNNKNELITMLKKLSTSSYKDKFIIQDFIPGYDSNMRVLTCYCDQNSKVKFFALGHVLLEEHILLVLLVIMLLLLMKLMKKFLNKLKDFLNMSIILVMLILILNMILVMVNINFLRLILDWVVVIIILLEVVIM